MFNYGKSGNPTLSDKVFKNIKTSSSSATMTVRGTATKFLLMMILIISSATYTWRLWFLGESVMSWLMLGVFGGLVLAIVISFNPRSSAFLAPIYALLEGLFLGGISAILQEKFQATMPNIVLNAVGLTFGVILTMAVLYLLRIIKPTQKFKSIVISSTMGIGIFYLGTILLSFFGVNISIVYGSSIYSIIFSLIVVIVASLNIILDLERIEYFSANKSPKYMEWYCSFGLTVTVIWLYFEIIRLLSKLASNR